MPHVVLAYIDPGSGSLMIQVLVASIIAIPVIFRSRLAQLTSALRRRKDTPDPDDVAESE